MLLLSTLIRFTPSAQPQPDVRAHGSPAIAGEVVQAWPPTLCALEVCVHGAAVTVSGWSSVYEECEFPHTNFDSLVQRKILITTFASAETLIFTKRTLWNRLNNTHFSPC